jgi:hypothetical protein
MLAGVLALWLSPPARAGVAEVYVDPSDVAYLTFDDPAGVADEIHFASPAEDTVIVLGPTVTAGSGCAPVPGGASCTRPPTSIWERTSIATGGGDDTVMVDVPQQMRIFGGDGNDRITFGAATTGEIYGMEGDDVLSAAGSARIEAGDGNDLVSAGAASSLSGGAGTDRLDGSSQDDVLVDAGDRGSRDVIACNGGDDVTQGDGTDTLQGCTRGALDKISTVDYFWRVRFGPRLSVPTRLRVSYSKYYGKLQGPFAECIGAPCHGARFDFVGDDTSNWRIVSGGKRIRLRGRWWRGVSPGAIVRVGLELTFSDVQITKGLEFRTRARQLPTVRKRCTVAIVKPPRSSARGRVVPCT